MPAERAGDPYEISGRVRCLRELIPRRRRRAAAGFRCVGGRLEAALNPAKLAMMAPTTRSASGIAVRRVRAERLDGFISLPRTADLRDGPDPDGGLRPRNYCRRPRRRARARARPGRGASCARGAGRRGVGRIGGASARRRLGSAPHAPRPTPVGGRTRRRTRRLRAARGRGAGRRRLGAGEGPDGAVGP